MRTALIGNSQVGGIWTYQALAELSHAVGIAHRAPDFAWLMLSALLQSGVHRVETLFPFAVRSSLNERVRIHSDPTTSDVYPWLYDIFKAAAPVNYDHTHDPSRIHDLRFFITELLCAAKLNCSLVWLGPIPSADKLKHVIAPEVLLPVATLLSSIVQVTPETVVPRTEVLRNDVESIAELLDSLPFGHYVEAQALFDDADVPPGKAAAAISKRHVHSGAAIDDLSHLDDSQQI